MLRRLESLVRLAPRVLRAVTRQVVAEVAHDRDGVAHDDGGHCGCETAERDLEDGARPGHIGLGASNTLVVRGPLCPAPSRGRGCTLDDWVDQAETGYNCKIIVITSIEWGC